MKRILKGVVPPMLTPLLSNWTLDYNRVKKLIDHLIDGGVHGIFILGTTGESTSLSYQTRRDLIERTSEYINGIIPFLVGITDTSIEESLSLASLALDSGAEAVVAKPLFIFIWDKKNYLNIIGT